jgi:capsular polysaccharide transport system permease protein
MVAWAPPAVQKFLLYIPFVHPIEMVRSAVFGEFVETHYNAIYAVAWGTVFNIIGLALVLSSREKIETE